MGNRYADGRSDGNCKKKKEKKNHKKKMSWKVGRKTKGMLTMKE